MPPPAAAAMPSPGLSAAGGVGAGAMLAQDITAVGSALMLAVGAIALVAPRCSCRRGRRSSRAGKLVRGGPLAAVGQSAAKRVRAAKHQGAAYNQLSRVEVAEVSTVGVVAAVDVTTVEL